MRFVSASAAARAAAAARCASPRRTHRAAPPRRAATVRARRDEATASSPVDPNERLREELRRSLRAEAEADGAEADSRDRPPGDDAGTSTRETRETNERESRGERASRRYAITVREREVFRYTLPDFFPDFNMTPLEARRDAGLDDELSTYDEARNASRTRRPYVWRRGVLAGTERSDPLDVIARDRERFENVSAETEPPARESRLERSETSHPSDAFSSRTSRAASLSKRRTIPPPPRRSGAGDDEEGGLGLGGVASKALLGLTLFFYLVALLATSSRAFLGDSRPAPGSWENGASTERAPSAVPDSIRGTRAGEMWLEKILDEGAGETRA